MWLWTSFLWVLMPSNELQGALCQASGLLHSPHTPSVRPMCSQDATHSTVPGSNCMGLPRGSMLGGRRGRWWEGELEPSTKL